MKIKRAQKALAMIIISAICFALFSFGTAAVSIDTRGSITLTTLSKENKEPVSGAVFRIYYLASAHQSGDGFSIDMERRNTVYSFYFRPHYKSPHFNKFIFEYGEHSISAAKGEKPYFEHCKEQEGELF